MISLIVPFMDLETEGMTKKEYLHRMLDSCTGYDEVLLIENERAGYAIPINYGLERAKGDFLIVANDDMVWDGGSLERLCDPDAVTCPMINGSDNRFSGIAFCLPRKIYEKVGGLYEGYKIAYFEDDDYYQILARAGVRMYCKDEVKTTHQGQTTIRRFADSSDFYKENEQLFIQRWGGPPSFEIWQPAKTE